MEQQIRYAKTWYSKRTMRVWWMFQSYRLARVLIFLLFSVNLAQIVLYIIESHSFNLSVHPVRSRETLEDRRIRLVNDLQKLAAQTSPVGLINHTNNKPISTLVIPLISRLITSSNCLVGLTITPEKITLSGTSNSMTSLKEFCASLATEQSFKSVIVEHMQQDAAKLKWSLQVSLAVL